MSDQVKRYDMCIVTGGMIAREGGSFCHIEDYATLQAELSKSKDETLHLHSQLKALRSDAALGAAIQYACGELPEGYILNLYLERFGSCMSLELPDTDAVYEEFDGDQLPDQIKDAVKKAKALDGGCLDERYKAAYGEWSDKTEWVQQTATAKELGKHRADILRERIDSLKAECERLQEELAALKANLQDQNTVFVNMMRGILAKPSARQIAQLFGDVVNGEDALQLELASARAELAAIKAQLPSWLIPSAKSLLDLDAKGCLATHAIDDHARNIIEAFIGFHEAAVNPQLTTE